MRSLGHLVQCRKKRSIYYCFQRIGSSTKSITAEQLQKVEEFVCVLYGVPQGSLASIRLRKFQNSTDDDLRKLCPSREALSQHVKRSCYQAGYLWQESLMDFPLPEPTEWGWKHDERNGYMPQWLTTTSSIDLEKFITTCSCKTGKCKQCKCAKLDMVCIRMCGCDRKCEESKPSKLS